MVQMYFFKDKMYLRGRNTYLREEVEIMSKEDFRPLSLKVKQHGTVWRLQPEVAFRERISTSRRPTLNMTHYKYEG